MGSPRFSPATCPEWDGWLTPDEIWPGLKVGYWHLCLLSWMLHEGLADKRGGAGFPVQYRATPKGDGGKILP